MSPLDFSRLAVGDRVEDALLVLERAERQTRSGERFVVLTLGNPTGQIQTKPVWSNHLDEGWADGAERGHVVRATGRVARYERNGQRQLELSAPLHRLPHDPARIVEQFLPRIDHDVATLWDALDRVR